MASSSRHRRKDEGQALTIAIVVVVVFGLVAVAVATYATASFTRTTVTRERTDKTNAANSGLRYGIERLRIDVTRCASPNAFDPAVGETFQVPEQLNQRTVEVFCSIKSGLPLGVNGWAAVITGDTVSNAGIPLLGAQGGSSRDKVITGPVFFNARQPDPTNDFNLQSNVRMKLGYLYAYDSTATDCSTRRLNSLGDPFSVNRLSFEPASLYGFVRCDLQWFQVVAPPALGSAPADAPAFQDIGSCRVFSPGRYAAIPALREGGNYFRSGTYYFDNIGYWNMDKAIVTAGPPGPADVQVIANPACASQIASETGVSGATFVLGGNSRMSIGNQSSLEIFRRCLNTATNPPSCGIWPAGTLDNVSIAQVGSVGQNGAATGSGYASSTVTANGTDAILTTKEGNTNDMVIHGQIYLPRGLVGFGNVTNTVFGQALGGIVAARLDLDASASASNFVIQVETGPYKRVLNMVATAKGVNGKIDVKATAEVEIANTTGLPTSITSWRVSAG